MVSLRVPPQAAVGTTNEIALEVQPYLNTPSGEFQNIWVFLPGRLQSRFATVVLDGGMGPCQGHLSAQLSLQGSKTREFQGETEEKSCSLMRGSLMCPMQIYDFFIHLTPYHWIACALPGFHIFVQTTCNFHA